jgi:uncharacterized membrane protein YwaF
MVAPVLGGGDPRLLGRRERRRVVDGIWRVRNSLPLQLTDGVSLCAILALLTQQQLLIELVYFWSFSPLLQAVLTPDLGSTFPSVFYFTLPISSTTLASIGVGTAGVRRDQWPRACWCSAAADIHAPARSGVYGLTLVWTAIAAIADLITGGNYMYLANKPVHASLLNAMGPWPTYIASGAVLGLAMFTLLVAIAKAVQHRDSRPAADGHVLLP